MKKLRLFGTIAIAALITAFTLLPANAAYENCNFRERVRRFSDPGTDYFESKLDPLVSAGTISSEQKKAIIETVEDALNDEMLKDLKAALNKLTAEGTIKAGQNSRVAYAVSEALKSGKGKIGDAIESIVMEGSLTPQQADFIKAAVAVQRRQRMKGIYESALNRLEADGTISGQMKSDISTAVENEGSRGLGSSLNRLIDEGKITPEMEDKIFEAVGDSMKEAMRLRFEAAVRSLAKDKVLTEEQAGAVIQALK